MIPKTQSTHGEKSNKTKLDFFKKKEDSGSDTVNLDNTFCSDQPLVMLLLKVNEFVKPKRSLQVHYSITITLCCVKINNNIKILLRRKLAP